MNSLFNTNIPSEDIYSDYRSPSEDSQAGHEYDIDDMIFSSLPEIKLHSER